jgi:protein gp37
MSLSAIEWTESTWNPLTGCTKVSAGCAHCYAEVMARRLRAMELARGNTRGKYRRGFKLTIHRTEISKPLDWKKPQNIFVNSMSDLFHEDVPLDFILKVFDTMNAANWHRYQILTKRSVRLRELNAQLQWAPHIWMGTTVENSDCIARIDDLRATAAHIKFLSLEPLLGPLPDLDLTGIDWAIVGGESGVRSRPMSEEWVLDIRDQCADQGVRFFFKQWGGRNKKQAGRILEGRTWDDMPASANL